MKVWNFVYLPDETGGYCVTLDMRNNPQFFLCNRRFPDTLNCADFADFKEVITLTEPIEIMTGKLARDYSPAEKQQILCEYCMLDKNENVIDEPNIVERVIEGFTFCGFEVAEECETSALTNCGFRYDRAFTKDDLNRWGSDRQLYKGRERSWRKCTGNTAAIPTKRLGDVRGMAEDL